TGFFKANVSTMVGQLYRENDPRRDGGFTIFYMGINLGAFIGPLVCGALAASPRFGWHWGFAAAGVGMVLSLIMFVSLRSRYLPGTGLPPERGARRKETPAVAVAAHPHERQHVLALFVVFLFIIFFWAAFEQAGSSMNLFAAEHTDLGL